MLPRHLDRQIGLTAVWEIYLVTGVLFSFPIIKDQRRNDKFIVRYKK